MKNMLKSITMSLVVVSAISCHNPSTEARNPFSGETMTAPESMPYEPTPPALAWLDLGIVDSTFILSMPYATVDNFLKEKIYPCAKCFLRNNAGEALLNAQKDAQSKGYSIIIYDCYRPLPLQQKMFDIKPDTKYIADPKRGSKHNKGVAVDISLADKNGNPLDMGTSFDDFSDKANYYSDEISVEAKKNRKLLREIMLANDFTPYDNEWWHFNYKKTDYPNADWVWDCNE